MPGQFWARKLVGRPSRSCHGFSGLVEAILITSTGIESRDRELSNEPSTTQIGRADEEQQPLGEEAPKSVWLSPFRCKKKDQRAVYTVSRPVQVSGTALEHPIRF